VEALGKSAAGRRFYYEFAVDEDDHEGYFSQSLHRFYQNAALQNPTNILKFSELPKNTSLKKPARTKVPAGFFKFHPMSDKWLLQRTLNFEDLQHHMGIRNSEGINSRR
jgi:hypothetical protein